MSRFEKIAIQYLYWPPFRSNSLLFNHAPKCLKQLTPNFTEGPLKETNKIADQASTSYDKEQVVVRIIFELANGPSSPEIVSQ